MSLFRLLWPSRRELNNLLEQQRDNRARMLKLAAEPGKERDQVLIHATDKAAEFGSA